MVEKFKVKYPNLQCVQLDIETNNLDILADASVDGIFMSGVFEFIVDKERLIKLCFNKLKV